MSILPTVGRTIHWHDAYMDGSGYSERERVIFVTGLDYGPRVERTAILGRDYTEGDPFNTQVFPSEQSSWHYADDCPLTRKRVAKP